MISVDDVCSTCRSVLITEQGLVLDTKPCPLGWVTPPGQSFDTFRDAALHNCVICYTAWNASDHDQLIWAKAPRKAWKPLMYKVEAPRNREDFVKLRVMYTDSLNTESMTGMYKDLRFSLIAVENENYSSRFAQSNTAKAITSKGTLEAASDWLHTCYSTHVSCRQLRDFSSGIFPTRLIDVGIHGDSQWILRNVKNDNITPASPYITLSYRWGPNPKLRLLSSNIKQFSCGIPTSVLPQTFKDLDTVARQLGVRYVWIDALCIIQDCIRDWEAEAPTMGYVYANSICNIAAAGALNPEEKMIRPRNIENTRPRIVLSALFAEKPSPHYIFERSYWDLQIRGPLHKRGWIFQERLLSPRVLYFGKEQVPWECLSSHKCESFRQGIPGYWSDKNMDPLLNLLSKPQSKAACRLHVFNLWNSLVEQYSHCDLTRLTDKMFAMAGIAKLFRDVTGDEYVAGWWKSHLIEYLGWSVIKPKPQHEVRCHAPSWSWASTDSPVHTAGTNGGDKFLMKLVDVNVATRGLSVMANITEATLTLQASIFDAVCHYGVEGNRIFRTAKGEFGAWLYPDCLDIRFPEGRTIVCLAYKTYYTCRPDETSDRLLTCFMTDMVDTVQGKMRLWRLGVLQLADEQAKNIGDVWETKDVVLK